MWLDFSRLHFSQSSCKLRIVLAPPLENGIIWSNSKFSWLPHLTQRPLSLLQTAS